MKKWLAIMGVVVCVGVISSHPASAAPDTVNYVDCRMNYSFMLSDGCLWACGTNDNFQLGSVPLTDAKAPRQINEGVSFKDIETGWGHSIAIDADGKLYTWGANNCGQLGTGDYLSRKTPTWIMQGIKFVAASVGVCHSLAVDENGSVWAFGLRDSGRLGTMPELRLVSKPVRISIGEEIADVCCGESSSYAVSRKGIVYSWGANEYGQLGIGNTDEQFKPVVALEGELVKYLSVRFNHGVAITADSTLVWGRNNKGQLGIGFTSEYETGVWDLKRRFRYASAGREHTVAINGVGRLYVAGSGEFYQTGKGTNESMLSFSRIYLPNDDRFLFVSSADTLTLAVDTELNAWGFGTANIYQFGNDTKVLGKPMIINFADRDDTTESNVYWNLDEVREDILGKTITVNNVNYKVEDTNSVSASGIKKTATKVLTIKDMVSYDERQFKVTKIEKLGNLKKATKVNIQSKWIESIEDGVFKSLSAGSTLIVPTKKVKKLVTQSGVKPSVVVKVQ